MHVPHDSIRATTGTLPGIVMLHGAPGDAWGMGGVAIPVARQGAIVLVLDAPFARRNKNNPLSFTPSDGVDQVQLVVDLQRAVDVLIARPDDRLDGGPDRYRARRGRGAGEVRGGRTLTGCAQVNGQPTTETVAFVRPLLAPSQLAIGMAMSEIATNQMGCGMVMML